MFSGAFAFSFQWHLRLRGTLPLHRSLEVVLKLRTTSLSLKPHTSLQRRPPGPCTQAAEPSGCGAWHASPCRYFVCGCKAVRTVRCCIAAFSVLLVRNTDVNSSSSRTQWQCKLHKRVQAQLLKRVVQSCAVLLFHPMALPPFFRFFGCLRSEMRPRYAKKSIILPSSPQGTAFASWLLVSICTADFFLHKLAFENCFFRHLSTK